MENKKEVFKMKNNLVLFGVLICLLFSSQVSADKYWAKIQKVTVDQQKVLNQIERDNDKMISDKKVMDFLNHVESSGIKSDP